MLEGYKGTAPCFSHGHSQVTEFLNAYALSTGKGAPALPQRSSGPGGPLHPHTTKVKQSAGLLVSWA